MSAPERIWVWCLNGVRHGGWRDWGGYARADRRYPLDGVEEETGAEYIRADLAPAAPKVKALVWEDWSARHRTNFTAITGFGRYGIMQMHFPEMHFKIETPYKKTLYAATIEAAKAAAQADYEARILAALEGGDA